MQTITAIFEGIDPKWKAIINKPEIVTELTKILNEIIPIADKLSPKIENIFNAFKLTPFDDVKVVLLGQDPYPNIKNAMGLSFSVTSGQKIPDSLKQIYECLIYNKLLAEMPTVGDLTPWAKNGVLLLNTALTTLAGHSNTHADLWAAFTNMIISEISSVKTGVIFILLGTFAHKKAELTNSAKHTIVTWGHPSPLNKYNLSDNPKHFKYCDAFTIATKLHGINWATGLISENKIVDINNNNVNNNVLVNSATSAMSANNDIYVFTDGASSGNGQAKCKASWAFLYSRQGVNIEQISQAGLVPAAETGEVYETSNNRGELMAILNGLKYLKSVYVEGKIPKNDSILFVSDSEYAINCITIWYNKWIHEGHLGDKKNLDLIGPASLILEELKLNLTISFKHINSHKDPPAKTSTDYWLWYGNDIVDKLCNMALRSSI